jgi:hypothetical protein
MTRNLFPVLAFSLLLAACGSSGAVNSAPAQAAGQTRVAVRTPAITPPPRAKVQAAPGLEGVIGATPDDLIREFGTARLDVWEGDARKLQFVGQPCVLDIYLYPLAKGQEPQATYVEARRASDGQEVDRAACIAALRGR